jgi:folate-binding protein YgfZ
MHQASLDTDTSGARHTSRGSFIDIAGRAAVLLLGSDGQDLLQRLSTNDLSKLRVGGCVQTILTNEKGRIIDVPSVLKLGRDKLLLVGQSEDPRAMLQWLDKFIIMEDARTEPATSLFAHFVVFDFDSDVDGLKAETDLEGVWDYVEDWGRAKLFHFLVDTALREELANRLAGAGVRQAGLAEFEVFRIKSGIPSSPNELSDGYNPLEANLRHLISWTKGCYIGQEVIARLDTYKKVQRRLVKLMLKEMPEALPRTLFDENDEAGTLTSAARLPNGSTCAGLGYVRANLLEIGRPVSFRENGSQVAAILMEEFNRSREDGG